MMIGTMCFLIWILTGQVLPKTEFFKPTKFLANKLTSVLQPGERIGDYPSSEKKFMTFNPHFSTPAWGEDRRLSILREKIYDI